MSQNNVSTWLKFALQQMAAESYLDRAGDLTEILTDGNNDRRIIPLDQFAGKTQFTDLQAQQFVERYQIVDHHANDATGFSATLMRDTTTEEYTLSFRSTESRPVVEGGDRERDFFGADVEIGTSGFAFGQLAAMEEYFARLKQGIKSDGAVDASLQAFFSNPAHQINVTGYSLGSHLATVFTELHHAEITQTYLFNGPGRGQVPGEVPGLAAEEARISDMLIYFRSVLDNPGAAHATFSRDNPIYDAARAAHTADPGWDPFDQGATSLYGDARYEWAKAATQALFNPSGLVFLLLPGDVQDQGPFAKIMQLYGQATTDDLQFVANAGLHAPAIPVFIEGQPLIAGAPALSITESANTHSLTLIVDSLAVQELIQTIDPLFGQAGAELLIKAVSNAKADTVASLNVSGVAEGDSLEKIVDALRRLFVGTNQSLEPLPVDSTVGGFGNLAFRNEMYDAIAAAHNRVTTKQSQGVTFILTDLTDPDVDRATLLARADANTAAGLAYRFALKELNPFVVTTNSDFETGALYAGFNMQGELGLYDPATGTGTFTTFYMDDRAAFLKEKGLLNQADRDISSGSIYFFDATQAYEITTADDPENTRQFLFGSDADERFESGSKDDDLYGGAGVDLLIGNGGNDYLQGDGGGDQLEGGAGIDRLVGGVGVDILDGGSENDTLDGGLGNDVLKGGTGLDRYIVRAVDGADTIEDSDGKGVVEFDGKILLSGLRRTDDPANIFHSADGTITLTKSGADLVVTGSGPLTIKQFNNGLLGMRLVEEGSYAAATRTVFQKIDHYVQVGNLPDGTPIYEPVYAAFFDDTANDTRNTAPIGGLATTLGDENNLIHALGGNDFILSGAGDDQLYGEDGDDWLAGFGGHDQLYGGIGQDTINGDDSLTAVTGNDYLDGGDGDDVLQGSAGADIVFGGSGNDNLNGDDLQALQLGIYGNDYLDGGDGADEVHGVGGADVLVGGVGNDFLLGDAAVAQGGTPEAGGADSLDGGSGQDYLDGQFGDDVLVGGLDDDGVHGGDGSDVLYGGVGNDTLSGDLRLVVSGSSYALQEYRGAGGDDLLFGEAGNDKVIGGEGSDVLQGDIGDDSLFGDYNTGLIAVTDPLYWTLFTAPGSDQLHAGAGNDALQGGFGADSLLAGEGDDTLIGGAGDDALEGGADDDILYGEYALNSAEFFFNPFILDIRALSGNDRLDGGAGQDQLRGGLGDDTLLGRAGNDLLFDDEPSAEAVGGNDILDGGDGDDYFQSWWGDDVLHGGAGNDQLSSLFGQDVLYGDEGDDWLSSGFEFEGSGSADTRMVGGLGDDEYFVDGVGDGVVEENGEGVDTVFSTINYTLPDYVENGEGFGVSLTGNDLNNDLSGSGSANVIDGRGGADTMRGRFGDDTYSVDNAGDVVIEEFSFDGTDIVQSSVTYALPIYVENLILTGSQMVNGTGNSGNNSLTGNDTANILTGGQGNDTLGGGAGSDTYVFNLGDGIDTIEDTSSTGEGNRIQFGAGIANSDLVYTEDRTAHTLTIQVGSSGADQLVLTPFDPTGATGSLVVDTLAFADDSTINLADLFPPIVNHAPTLSAPLADQTVPEDAPFSLTVPANTFADDDVGDVLTVSASLADGTALPAWLSFDAVTATFSGTPDNAQVSSLNLRVTATDAGNLSVSDDFALTVTNVNEAPTVAAPLVDQQATEDASFTFVVPTSTFADVDQAHGDTLIYSASLSGGGSLPSWLSFDASTRTFSGMPLNGDVGTLALTVTATDQGNLSISTGLSLTVQNVNDSPSVTTPLLDQTASEDSAFTFAVPGTTFTDIDLIHGDVLTYSATLADGNPLPVWLSFNPTTRTFTGTPGAGDAGTPQIAVTATDNGNVSVTDQFALVISGPLPETVVGTAGDDVLTGGRGDDTLVGLASNDTLNGGDGHDLLDGGTGTDTMVGGTGHDTYLVDASGDVVTELANDGTDTVQSSITYTLGANVENLTLTGTGNLNGTGNALDNTLAGNSGINVLTGGAGNDTYVVGAGDRVVENFNGGTDTVVSAATWTLGSSVENLTLTGTANLNGTGNVLNNVLVGNSGANTLDGGAGNDTVDGGEGNDTLLGGSGDDQLLGRLGTDVLNAGSGHDVLTGGDGTDTLDGGSGDDQLLGGTGNDSLTGGSGADQLAGGTGNDTVTGHSGNDRYQFSRSDGQDTISDADPFPGNHDTAVFGAMIDPLDLVISRQANDLRLAIHGSSDQITVKEWYLSNNNWIETIQTVNGQTLLSTQVDQLIQAMAGFTAQTGLTWDQAIDQQPQEVQAVLAASWQ